VLRTLFTNSTVHRFNLPIGHFNPDHRLVVACTTAHWQLKNLRPLDLAIPTTSPFLPPNSCLHLLGVA
jgi:hypothetical protein